MESSDHALDASHLPGCLALAAEAGWNQIEADWRLMLGLGRGLDASVDLEQLAHHVGDCLEQSRGELGSRLLAHRDRGRAVLRSIEGDQSQLQAVGALLDAGHDHDACLHALGELTHAARIFAGAIDRELRGFEIERWRRQELDALEITERVPLEAPPNDNSRAYLRTKREKLGHLLNLV